MFPHVALARFTKTVIGSAAAAAALIAASTPAFAGDRASRSVEVSFTDLDLTTDAGAKALESRIKVAARSVCTPAPTKNLADKIDHMSCIRNARGSGQSAMVTLIAKAKNDTKFAVDERMQIGN